MTVFYPTEQGSVAAPVRPIDGGGIKQLSVVRRTFTLATQTTSDTLTLKLPAGFRPAYLGLHPSATLGSSTLSFGPSGTLGKYRAAATLTASSLAPVVMGANAKLTADEDVIVTIAAASLPASGSLIVEFLGYYD